MLNILLFDAFRTLFDTKDTHTLAVERIFETQGIAGVDVDAFHKQWDLYIVEGWRAPGEFKLQWPMFAECLEKTFRHFGVTQCDVDAGIRLWADLVASAPPFPEVAAMMQAIRARYKTAIVSNSDNFEMEICLNRMGLDFDAVFTSEDLRCYKPRPEIFLKALDHFGAAPDQAIMIGDSLKADVQGAHNAGIRAVWINRSGDVPGADLPQPDFTLPDLIGLPALLETL